jgi:hypothetical protein
LNALPKAIDPRVPWSVMSAGSRLAAFEIG